MADIKLEAAGRTSQCSLPLPLPPLPPPSITGAEAGGEESFSQMRLERLGRVRAMCAALISGDHRAPLEIQHSDGSHVSHPAVSLMDAGNELGEDDTLY